MNIEYFECSFYGWAGRILKRSINTEDPQYVSHTDDTVTIKELYEDINGEMRLTTLTLPRNFVAFRDQIIADNKEKLNQLQKNISILQNSNNFEQYAENV